jgi:uncharacterized protein (TIGR02284 family)
MVTTDKTIDLLNDLVEINNDRIEGYETAFKETNELDLKALFTELAQTSYQCKNELVDEVRKMGGTPTESTRTSGKFFRVWMDVKAALTGNDRKAILNSCEYGEDKALEAYHNILQDETENIPVEMLSLISAQYNMLKEDHDRIKSLRDAS